MNKIGPSLDKNSHNILKLIYIVMTADYVSYVVLFNSSFFLTFTIFTVIKNIKTKLKCYFDYL